MCQFVKSVTETNSKIQEPNSCNQATNNFIADNRWRKINMRSYETYISTKHSVISQYCITEKPFILYG